MTKNYKHLAFEGSVGADATMRYTPAGKAVTNFNVAVNDDYKDNNGNLVKKVCWFRVSTWDGLAELCNQYVKKGGTVIVEGWLNPDPATGGPRIWNGQDGSPRASFEMTAQTVRFLSTRDDNGAQPKRQSESYGNMDDSIMPDGDDISW